MSDPRLKGNTPAGWKAEGEAEERAAVVAWLRSNNARLVAYFGGCPSLDCKKTCDALAFAIETERCPDSAPTKKKP